VPHHQHQHQQQPCVAVTFIVQFRAAPGTCVAVCGDAPGLGGWRPAAAARMAWRGGDSWAASVELPAG
jgi:hypothetical protein